MFSEKIKKITLNQGQQNKHIVNSNNYDATKNRSILSSDINPETLIDDIKNNKIEKIRVINENKLKINFGKNIGEVKKYDGSSSQSTTWGIIHIDKNGGAHIVPAFPDEF